MLHYRQLGNTGLVVSSLCFGVLTIGPLQNNLPTDIGSDVLAYGLRKGINFFDTAKVYKTYPYIKEAIKKTGIRPIISTKSYDFTYSAMKNSVEQALDEMEINYIDIFMLHEQENSETLKGHREAIKYLTEAREKGIIKAIGISTHSIAGVIAGGMSNDIQVIHPLINIKGIGIIDGTKEQMIAAIRFAHSKGKGIYAMKALAGGNLYREAYKAFSFVRNLDCVHSMAVGMKNIEEIELNISWIEGKRNQLLESKVNNTPRKIKIENWCEVCGNCVTNCRYNALNIINNRVSVDYSKCILCGYCARFCSDFCIKMV